jgi:non-specific serine/threonine protein kinase
VPAFAAPDPAKLDLVDLLMRFESLRLFVERAAAVQPGFALTSENAQAVAEICQRLDGIPLAIELAAARIRVLTVEQIAAYLAGALGARFALLTQGSRAVLPRHQTLRATIDWSYNLLDDAERLLFRQVAVFRGGFTLEALAWIVDPNSQSALPSIQNLKSKIQNPLDLLTQLVDKSLVIVEPQGGENRYRLLETLREYALEQFNEPEEMEALRRRHADYFLTLVQRADPALTGVEQQHWLARLETEHANLRDALAYATAGADRELALRLTASLAQFWDIRVYLSEGREWLGKALAQRGAASDETQARALIGAGFLAYRQDDYPVAQQLLQEGLWLFEHAEEEAGIAESLHNLAAVDLRQGRYRAAQQRLEQSLALFRALNHSDGMARALNSLGNWAWDQGKNRVARDYYSESLQIRQRLGDQVGIATALFNLGNAARTQGDFVAARTYYEDCLALSRTLDHRALIAIALKSLGLVAFHQQDYMEARHAAEEALRLLQEIGDRSNAAFTFSNLGAVARKLGETGQALDYFRQSLQLMHELGHIRGTFMGLEAIASLLVDLDEHLASTVHLLGAAAGLRQKANLPVPPSEQPEFDRILTHLHQRLDDATFSTTWETGQTNPLAQVVAEAMTLSLHPAS